VFGKNPAAYTGVGPGSGGKKKGFTSMSEYMVGSIANPVHP